MDDDSFLTEIQYTIHSRFTIGAKELAGALNWILRLHVNRSVLKKSNISPHQKNQYWK